MLRLGSETTQFFGVHIGDSHWGKNLKQSFDQAVFNRQGSHGLWKGSDRDLVLSVLGNLCT